MTLKSLFALASFLTLAALAAPAAQAMTVSPMHIEMLSVGQTGRSQFTVTNSSADPLPVETVVKRLEIDTNGTSHETPDAEDFLVFPPQVMIPPGSSQVFRVQWVGEPNLAQSQSYLLSVTEIPLKGAKAKSSVQIVTSFGLVIDVAPPQGQPDMKLVETGIQTDKHGKRHATITVENTSNVHGLLENANVHLSGGSWSKSYAPGQIAQSMGLGIVQPGKRRLFVLPDVLPADVSQIQASLDYPQH